MNNSMPGLNYMVNYFFKWKIYFPDIKKDKVVGKSEKLLESTAA